MLSHIQIEQARVLLSDVETIQPGRPLNTLAAAALAATAAVLLAGVMVLGPGVTLEDRSPAEAALG